MEELNYNAGAIVQLRSGGPLLTVTKASTAGNVYVIYYNSISGLFEQFNVAAACLKPANSAPELPKNARDLRNTGVNGPVAKSSLS